MPTLAPFPHPSAKEGTSIQQRQAKQQCGYLMQADGRHDHGEQALQDARHALAFLRPLTSSASLPYNASSRPTTAGMRPLHTLRHREEDACGLHAPFSMLSHGKETEHGSTSPHA